MSKKGEKKYAAACLIGQKKMKIHVCSCMPAVQSNPTNADISEYILLR